MRGKRIHQILTNCIAAVWFVNGFFCKVLNLVPRHQAIVASILGDAHARSLTLAIGIAEIGMAFWIVSRRWTQLNAVAQILIIATMNILEFLLVPDLLLWGKANAIFAFVLIVVIYYNQYRLKSIP